MSRSSIPLDRIEGCSCSYCRNEPKPKLDVKKIKEVLDKQQDLIKLIKLEGSEDLDMDNLASLSEELIKLLAPIG